MREAVEIAKEPINRPKRKILCVFSISDFCTFSTQGANMQRALPVLLWFSAMGAQVCAAATPTAFLDTIGICGTASSFSAEQMKYLGISHLRTGLTASQNLVAASIYKAKMDIIMPWYMSAITTSTLSTSLQSIDAASSVIESIEGPNEVNRDPDTFNGLAGPAGIMAEQKALFGLVMSDPAMNNAGHQTPVLDFSVLQGTPANIYSGMAPYSQYSNVHAYGGPGIPPSWILPYEVTHNTIAGSNPVRLTETGATTISNLGVNEAMQARFDIEALLDAYQLGVGRTYLYNLQDWATGSNVNNFSAYYGLYNTGGALKLSGQAMHNFTSILGHAPTALLPSSLPYTISGLPYYGRSQFFENAAGTIAFIVLWNETLEWNSLTHTEIPIPTNSVTVKLATASVHLSVYDPLTSPNPLLTVVGTSAVALLNKDPIIIEITP